MVFVSCCVWLGWDEISSWDFSNVPCVFLLRWLVVGFSVVLVYMISGPAVSRPLDRVCLGYSYLWWMEFFLNLVVLRCAHSWDST